MDYLDFEVYSVLDKEVIKILGFALLTVTLVVLLITLHVRVTFFVVTVVLLVVVYMTAVCHFWGLTLNHIVAINFSIALGIAVDFSVHIAHCYLSVIPPESLKTNQEKRDYKVSKAVS